MPERATTLIALARILDGTPAEDVVRSTLRALPHLNAEGRKRVARRLYGPCVLRRRLAYLVRGDEDGDIGGDDAALLLDAYVQLEEEGSALPRAWPAPGVARIAVERSAPRWLVEVLVASLGLEGADAFLAASNEPGPTTLRTNTTRVTRDALRSRLAEEGIATTPVALVDTALTVSGRANLFGSAAWRAGLFEVQDASSQLCAQGCGVRPGDVVVDACAGRGGKTLALAAALRDRGTLWFFDVDAGALADMAPRLARAGVTCARAGKPPPGSADVVLVDAPCSSLGPLRRSPDLRWRMRPEALAGWPPLQRQLLDAGASLVRPGGRIVYATCTVLRAENDDVVAAALATRAELHLVDKRQLLPHVDGCDGFFFATLERAR